MVGSKNLSRYRRIPAGRARRLKAVCTESRSGTLEAAHAEQSGSDDAERLRKLHLQKEAEERSFGAVNLGAQNFSGFNTPHQESASPA